MNTVFSSPARVLAAAALGLAPLAGAAAFAPAATAADTAKVTVVHGIPKLDVDVYVDGKVALEDFAFKTVTPEISLPVGTRKIDIRPAGAAATSKPVLSTSATLTSGLNATIVANLTADGKPTTTTFVNPTTSLPADKGRIVVRHVAAAPAVDILVEDEPLLEDLANGKEASVISNGGGKYNLSVAAAGTKTSVLGPLPVTAVSGKTIVAYAVGSLADKNLAAVVQTYSVSAQAPHSVPAGEGSTSNFGPASLALVGGLGVAGLALAASRARRRSTVTS